MRSLKGRLLLALGASLAALLGAQFWLVSGAIRGTAEDYVADRLRHDTETLLGGLERRHGGPALTERARGAIYRRVYSGHYFRIRWGEATLRSRSLWDADLPLPAIAQGESRRLHATGPREQPLLVRVAGFRKDGEKVVIAVAEDLSALRADLGAFRWRYAALAGIIGFTLLLVQWAVVVAGLRPLHRLRGEVGRLRQGEAETLPETGPAEVRPLVQEINRLIHLTHRRLERSRHALGDLGHALKTPLTRLYRLAEDPSGADPDLPTELSATGRAIQQRVDRAIRRARLAGGGPASHVDLHQEVEGLRRTLVGLYRDQAPAIDNRIPAGLTLPADREDMVELLGNLLDNACKWANGVVHVRAARQDGIVAITVADNGSGVPEAERTALLQRGTRLDEQTPGQGLGLAIARDIVEAYGGEIHLDQAVTLGGLLVEVRLPAGPGAQTP